MEKILYPPTSELEHIIPEKVNKEDIIEISSESSATTIKIPEPPRNYFDRKNYDRKLKIKKSLTKEAFEQKKAELNDKVKKN